ncbi:MAG: hypothetical protein K8T10_02195 [Candidatus Eremiobacteraeota bacterium]|nr:hypothetical protein [Candidatus Eremiobacteraeota bacterium]
MIVKFSRHAKRRAKLYKIPEATIAETLKYLQLSEGEHEIVKDFPGLKFPVKMIITVKEEIVTVITNYPFKKGIKK